ncbi:quinolinate synthase NadA [Clostridium folliculivorans]|uniref:Quinolinate synthase n=1 Tax=Clostridium folliculivorans TaxID=2886038 RepID=A0A9W5Y1B8_9CLOT|nr:quinolinate synthase NadA [Clostridium folliculivorans]GKU24687.1 quinolinate synthase [Clostridium folliculivorans]GKU30785.1 quinolinate synthase [Clostridium folliculivorans]
MSVIEEIQVLKREKNAIILAHYYQRPEVQEIADYIGDSYYLSKIAKDSDQNTIVFCGVKFMAESAKILSPHKKVLLPALDAGCPMADMATAEKVLEYKSKYPKAAVVCYINSSAEVKAVSDICCTSSNALKIVNSIDNEQIIFLPDKNLASYIQEKVPNKEIIPWPGFCITHKRIQEEEILTAKEAIEDLLILAHPECEKEIRDLSDFIGSTSEIIDYATSSNNKNFLIATEEGVIHELKKRNPNKKFFTPRGGLMCINMKKTSINDVRDALLFEKNEILLDEELRINAFDCLMRMHTV